MTDGGEQSGGGRKRPVPQRQPGWVLLTGVLGASCLMIGLIMLAMLQAPAVRPKVIATSVVFIAAGILLLPVVWMKRVRRVRPLIDLHPAPEVAPPSTSLEGLEMANIQFTPENSRKLDALSRETGKTHEQLTNDAVHQLETSPSRDEAIAFDQWRDAMLKVEGMWRDRKDLPDFEDVRRSMDRELWSRSSA
jgi:hypothetical protein